MLSIKSLFASLIVAAALPVIAQKDPAPAPLAPQTPLVVDGDVRVDAADFEGNMLRVPAERRVAFRMSQERVASVVDNVYVTRSLAKKELPCPSAPGNTSPPSTPTTSPPSSKIRP